MQLKIGLIGAGTIGSGVIEIIRNNSELIKKRTGIELVLKKVCDKDFDKALKLGIIKNLVTKDYHEIIDDKEIDIVVELIGGIEPARTIILEAIKSGKGVVTANKALVAKHGQEIFSEASKNNVTVNFEAAVCGCIPIIKIIRESYITERINSIYGILNGTTNFIISRMEEGMSYNDALKKAQALGFAEANPSFDVDGYDAAQKLVILSRLAYNSDVNDKIPCFGISKLTKQDIDYARELGYKIKLLAIAKLDNGELDVRVQPSMIPIKHALSNVNNELNAVYLRGDQTKETMFYGRGAGKLPTATVVVSDVIDLAKKKKSDENTSFFNKLRLKDLSTVESRFYIRFILIDKPGVFAKIAKILGDNNISINAVTQKEDEKEVVAVVFITHKAEQRNVHNAIQEIRQLDVVKEKPFYLMIEDF